MKIKFKAVTTDGKWANAKAILNYGDGTFAYIGNDLKNNHGNGWMIPFSECVEVIPETVCQFTGLLDKNVKEIYSGDICYSNNRMGVIEYGHGRFGINWDYPTDEKTMLGSWGSKDNLRSLSDGFNEHIEITGNIHDPLIKK